MVLMQVGEHNRSQLGSWRTGGCEPVTELADQRLDARSVAQETRSKPGVNDGVPVAGLHEHAVVAAGDRGLVPSFCRQGGVQFVVRHPRRGSEECRERRFPWRCHLAVADHRAAQAPNREPVDHRPILPRSARSADQCRDSSGIATAPPGPALVPGAEPGTPGSMGMIYGTP